MITREEFDGMIDKDKLRDDLEEVKALLSILTKVDIAELNMNDLHNDLTLALKKISEMQDELCPEEDNGS